MFNDANSFNNKLSSNQELEWDTSKVENMAYMFSSASNFNRSLNKWKTKDVTNMSHMFENAYVFNQPLNEWDTNKVGNMSYMFSNALSFDQPIIWNLSKIRNMERMFFNARNFGKNENTIITFNKLTNLRTINHMFTQSAFTDKSKLNWQLPLTLSNIEGMDDF
jgi:hypothetical protein